MVVAPRAIVRVTLIVAVAVFCVVQDRVTAAGARRYVAVQREALAAGSAPVAVDDIVTPAVSRSLQLGFLSAAAVVAAGLGLAAAVTRGRAISGAVHE